MISTHINEVLSGTIDIEEKTKQVLSKFQELNEKYTFMSLITKDLAIESAKNLKTRINNGEKPSLAGLFVTVKDCICIKDEETTASSKILKGYKPIFDATVIERLKDAGVIIIGKTLQDEFGFGSFSVNTGIDLDTPKNPEDESRVAGGSSGGCAVATRLAIKNKIPHISIAESTGGSIENPASFCGVIGFCPTYGRVSRNGLISYANSLDKIGIMAEKIEDVSIVLEVISGKDTKDSTTIEKEPFNYKKTKEQFRVGLIKESFCDSLSKEVKTCFESYISEIKKKGHIIEEISLPTTFEYGIPAYYIIATCEASTNLSCLSGLRYGIQKVEKNEHFSNYFKRIRSQNFGKEAKRRIMLGTFARMAGYRDAFYIKAAKVRTEVLLEYENIFKNYDIIISPTMPFSAPKISEIEKLKAVDHYLADIMTVGPNLAGIPHMSVPIGFDSNNLAIGAMISANHENEGLLIDFQKSMDGIK